MLRISDHNIVFSGNLLFLPLADVFQLLGGNNCTGILILRSPHSSDPGVVYFRDGNPINGSWGKLKGRDAVYALFGLADGKYEFSEEEITGIDSAVRQSTMEIVMDAMRLIDDGEIVRLGPDPLHQQNMKKTDPARVDMNYVHPIKGPLVDYRFITIERNYSDGTTILREGEHGKWLYVISEGTVRVTKETPRGTITLARLSEGCFIGTIRSFLYGEYERNATVIAEGNVELCLLDAESLHREYSSLSQEFRKILLSVDTRFRTINDNVVNAHIGAYPGGLPEDKVFDDRFQNTTDLYIIREGTADIIGKGPDGDVLLLSLGKDDVFGKIPFMAFGHEPVSASVMVSEGFEADIVDSRVLQREYDGLSQTFRNFIFGTATNISMTTRLFYELLGKIQPAENREQVNASGEDDEN